MFLLLSLAVFITRHNSVHRGFNSLLPMYILPSICDIFDLLRLTCNKHCMRLLVLIHPEEG